MYPISFAQNYYIISRTLTRERYLALYASYEKSKGSFINSVTRHTGGGAGGEEWRRGNFDKYLCATHAKVHRKFRFLSATTGGGGEVRGQKKSKKAT